MLVLKHHADRQLVQLDAGMIVDKQRLNAILHSLSRRITCGSCGVTVVEHPVQSSHTLTENRSQETDHTRDN